MKTASLPMLAAAVLLSSATARGGDSGFAAWHFADQWLAAGDATLDPGNSRRLAGKPGTGVIINGGTGKARSLVSKRRDFRDVEVHIEFMVAKGSNSGVIFHGLYEIQILDSHHVRSPTAGHCGGVYPRAETKPKYHYIDKGSPPRVNAAKPPGEWQTMDIIFQSPRFDAAGRKTAHAKFVKVTHNAHVIQEDHEVEWATGTNWDRKQHPQGPVIIQGDYGPIALRNVRVRDWRPGDEARPNVPPEGFTALFNGRDFTGWRLSPRARKMWSVEDGVLKAHGLLEQWGADLATEGEFRDFVLMADFRMPTVSDSGIHFRKLAPAMLGRFGDTEQFNIKADAAMGRLESFNFMTAAMKRKLGLKPEDLPRVKPTAPKVGEWHTVKITLVGRTLSAELDGETIIEEFEYPTGVLSDEPAAIRLQKHRYWDQPGGRKHPCPIEFRSIYIREVEPQALKAPPPGFTALFNGRDLTGWRTPPLVRKYWSVEDGVLKSPGLIETWG
ncbi:MAG: 3-keto-disaccharide hydrolase, partial [Planctomycetota bacterium]